MDHAAFMARLQAGKELPKTSAPFPGDFIAAFQELVPSGESIVCIHPSADVSGTVRSALTARESFPDHDIRVIDARTVAGPLHGIVLAAHRLATQGASADEVEALVREMMPRARLYFLVETLEYLRRGGRIGGASALVGTLLQIKPILTFANGRVDQFEKERTRKRALARIRELVATEAARGEASHLAVMHTGDVAEASAYAEELCQVAGAPRAEIMELVPAIIAQAGPGIIAVGFFTP
jgi:DegV family protein with EDD domain